MVTTPTDPSLSLWMVTELSSAGVVDALASQ